MELNFDRIIVYPGPQPRESSDIELYLKDQIVGRINQKTCISRDLKVTIQKLKGSISPWEDGMILLFVLFKDTKNQETLKSVIFYIPGQIIGNLPTGSIHEILQRKLKEKTKRRIHRIPYPRSILGDSTMASKTNANSARNC